MSNVVRVHLGLLRELCPGERRVALTPDDVRHLSGRLAIGFERNCGLEAGYGDNDYIAAGAHPVARDDLLSSSDILVSIRQPKSDSAIKTDSILAYLGSGTDAQAPAPAGKTPIYLDLALLAGLRNAGPMDVLSRQATIIGHAAVLEAVRELGTTHAMLTIDGNFVRPIGMAALGTGPSGLQAIATARRLGAITHGLGFEENSRQKVERLGARYLEDNSDPSLVYPIRGWSNAELTSLRRQLASQLSNMQMIVTNVAPAGETAPVLIDKEMLSALRPGSVIVDLAAEAGGNCALTQAGRVVEASGVRIIGTTTFASREPAQASGFFSEGMRHVLERLIGKDDALQIDRSDPFINAMIGDQHVGGPFVSHRLTS